MSDFDKELTNKLSALPNTLPPERDLWAGIALSIENDEMRHQNASPKQKSPLFQYAAIAASVLALSWLVFYIMAGQQTTPEANWQHGDALVQTLSHQHEQQKQVLLTKFQNQPAVTDDWQKQLQELDEAADAVKLALKEDSDNTALLGMLQHIYQQQLLLIERVHAPKWQQI